MAKGTSFGDIHSNRDLHLIQQSIEITPAAPRTSYVDIPGANGSKDLTEALGIGVMYQNRTITWTFALYPGESFETKKTYVSSLINGLKCRIVLDADPDYYYLGRISVKNYKTDKMLKQIVVEATCDPYKYKISPTTIIKDNLTTNYKTLSFSTDCMPVVPSINVTAETVVKFDNKTFTLNAGEHIVPDIRFSGLEEKRIQAKLVEESEQNESISLVFQEGAL